MNKSTSIYLDIVRFFAAVSVYLQHYNDWSGGRVPIFRPMQSHAVIVFFCLSGFVINFAVEKERYSPARYALNRFSRIASVAFPAILFTLTLDTFGNLYHPELYGPWSLQEKLTQLGFGVTFLNEAWGVHASVGFNPPYWSMGYEAPYYAIFGAAIFAKGFWRFVGAAALLLVVGPRVALLMGTWLIGIGAYQVCKSQRISPGVGLVILLCGASAWTTLYWAQLKGIWPTTLRPVNWHRSEIATDYLIAALFALTIIGVSAIDRYVVGVADLIAKPVRWVAGATFAVYLFHWPAATFLMRFAKIDPRNDLSGVGLTVMVLVACFLIANVTERQKDAFKGAIERLARLSPRRAA